MDDWISLALDMDVTAAASAVQVAALAEAERQADALLGEWPVPGGLEWHAEDGTDAPVRRARAWHLLHLRIGLGPGWTRCPP